MQSYRKVDDFSQVEKGVNYANRNYKVPITGIVDGSPHFGFLRKASAQKEPGERIQGIEIIWEHNDEPVFYSYKELSGKIANGEFIVRQDA